MASEHPPKADIIREYLDGSLTSEKMVEAEGLIERDPGVCTQLDRHDKLETFIYRLQEALAVPPFPAERDDHDSGSLRRAVAAQVQAPPAGDDTAALNINDPSVATDSQTPAVLQQDAFAFLSPPQAADEIGRLNGYRVLKLLGQGGMGVVFAAEDTRLKRRVALKVMKPEIAAKEEHRVRFLREAQTAAAVEHDFICPIYQVGEENGVPFIAMPFLKGEPLDAYLKRQQPLPIAEAIRIGREVAEGLAEAHKAGLVHRDIKPGNIWLESLPNGRSRCRILDFGLARTRGSDDLHLTKSGAIMGTPAYMAPEQARSRPVDHRADLFSLGVMLYEMTTGRRPFSGGDTMSILTSLALDEPTAPVLINTAVPVELSDLIMQMLSKSPEHRPASGQAVAEALLGALMKTTRPIVEVMPASAAPPRAKPTDQTAVDPWQGIDDSVPSEASAPERVERAAAPQTRPSSRRDSWIGWKIVAAAVLLLLIGGGFAAYKLSFETKDGTLEVVVDDDADVRFKNGKLQIFDADGTLKYTLAPSEKNKTLPPGKYLVKIAGADGVRLEAPEFVMEKNGKASVRVVALANKPNGPKNGLPSDPVATRPYALAFHGAKSYALAFGGVNARSRVVIPSWSYQGDHPLTVEAWAVFERPLDDLNGEHLMGDPEVSGFAISYGGKQPDEQKWSFAAFVKQRGYVFAREKRPLPRNELIHVAGVYEPNSEVRFYVNGQLQEKTPAKGAYEPSPVPFTLGANPGYNDSFSDHFLGCMQEVRVSKLARYDNNFTPAKRFEPDKDTLALYHFDEGQGDVLKDSSGNNRHGKIVGAKWVKPSELTAPAPITPSILQRFTWHESSVSAAAISGDGQYAVIGMDHGKAILWDAAGKKLQTFDAHNQRITAVDVTNDGKGVLTASWDRTAVLFDAADGKKRQTFAGLTAGINYAVLSRDGKQVLTGSGNRVAVLWDAASGKQLQTFRGHTASVNAVAFSDDGKVVLTGSEDKTAILWNAETGEKARTFDGFTDKVDCVALSPDGRRVVTGSGATTLWDAASGAKIQTFSYNSWVLSVAISHDGKYVLAGYTDNSTILWDAETGKKLHVINGHSRGVIRVAFSADGKRALTASSDRTAILWGLNGLPTSPVPLDPAWLERVAKLPAKEQVEAVKSELMKRNPGFDGAMKEEIVGGVATELEFLTDNVTDITPVRALTALRRLNVRGSGALQDRNGKLADLSPLKDMKLTYLQCNRTQVSDLSPLKDMKLTELRCGQTQVSDLSPLKDMKLTYLYCSGTQVSDLSPLKDMKLTYLHCSGTKVADLSPLQGMPLTDLACGYTKVADLTPLQGMPLMLLSFDHTEVSSVLPLKEMKLVKLNCHKTKVSDLSPLRGMPLNDLHCDFKPFRDTQVLRSIKTLKKIDEELAAEFWKEVEAQQAAFDAWVKTVAAMPPDKQVEAVKSELMKRNPDFDGKLQPVFDKDGVVTQLSFVTEKVTDIAPLRALAGLQSLTCNGAEWWGRGELADLSPLAKLKLTSLSFQGTKVTDLAPLKDLKLTYLFFSNTPVSDLSPLKGMPLTNLTFAGTKVGDLSPLKDMPLESLIFNNTTVNDLTPLQDLKKLTKLRCDNIGSSRGTICPYGPLQGLPLTELGCTIFPERDAKVLLEIKTLKSINDKTREQWLKEMSEQKK
jgi:WD40 repeat protein/serine/threonine protein kinase